MSAPAAAAGGGDNDARRQFYCRKEKSLAVLSSNFLKLYDRNGIESIDLGEAAAKLGVERRRIYDVVNILESIGIVAKKAKNLYSWNGYGAIQKALEVLQEEGLREDFSFSRCCNSFKVSSDSSMNISGSDFQMQENTSGSIKSDNKREKSLSTLTQSFVKLFLCTDAVLITQDNAAKALLGGNCNSKSMTTKIRRLYDIANVFSSVNLIEKTQEPETRKPAFRWLGWKGSSAQGGNESRKRIFGVDITNHDSKKPRMESSGNWKTGQKQRILVKHEDSENSLDSRGYVFGPFAPDSVMTKYRPHYQNQVLSDLFSHYMDAWKSWYTEVDRPI